MVRAMPFYEIARRWAPSWLKRLRDQHGPPFDLRESLLRRMPRRSICAEIGVWKGDFSELILTIAKPRRLHLVDPWRFEKCYPTRYYGGTIAASQTEMDEIYREVVARFEDRHNVTIHRSQSSEMALQFEDDYFDWVYIDGNHSYEFVWNDLTGYLPKVKRGGFLTGDDYEWSEAGRWPVKEAVDAFVATGNAHLTSLENGQFVLQRT